MIMARRLVLVEGRCLLSAGISAKPRTKNRQKVISATFRFLMRKWVAGVVTTGNERAAAVTVEI
jgi:hypothetical protein